MRRSAPTESQEQSAVVQWWGQYCKTKGLDERLLVAVPNGSHLAGDARARAIQMAKLKATGLRPGYPDLMLDLPMRSRQTSGNWPEYLFHGMRIELKRKGAAKPSADQLSYHALIRNRGYNVIVAIGADEAIHAIKSYVERAVLGKEAMG